MLSISLLVVLVSGQKGASESKEGKKPLTEQQLQRLKNRKTLESCLTLVRSLYSREEV